MLEVQLYSAYSVYGVLLPRDENWKVVKSEFINIMLYDSSSNIYVRSVKVGATARYFYPLKIQFYSDT